MDLSVLFYPDTIYFLSGYFKDDRVVNFRMSGINKMRKISCCHIITAWDLGSAYYVLFSAFDELK